MIKKCGSSCLCTHTFSLRFFLCRAPCCGAIQRSQSYHIIEWIYLAETPSCSAAAGPQLEEWPWCGRLAWALYKTQVELVNKKSASEHRIWPWILYELSCSVNTDLWLDFSVAGFCCWFKFSKIACVLFWTYCTARLHSNSCPPLWCLFHSWPSWQTWPWPISGHWSCQPVKRSTTSWPSTPMTATTFISWPPTMWVCGCGTQSELQLCDWFIHVCVEKNQISDESDLISHPVNPPHLTLAEHAHIRATCTDLQ